MRRSPTKEIEIYRVTSGQMASEHGSGPCGAFRIPMNMIGPVILTVIASDGRDWTECGFPQPVWEHVSVSLSIRCPTWQEMDFVKRIFWRDDETVMQLHVPRDRHLNYHETCLHLWKPVGVDILLPPSGTVAPGRK